VSVGWVFFRAPDLPHAARYLARLADFSGAVRLPPPLTWDRVVAPPALLALAAGALFAFLPAARRDAAPPAGLPAQPGAVAWRFAVAAGLLVLSASALAAGGFNPFIYFRF